MVCVYVGLRWFMALGSLRSGLCVFVLVGTCGSVGSSVNWLVVLCVLSVVV